MVPLQISDLAFGTGDFTVECWVYQTSNANDEDGIFQISTNSSGLNASNSNTITLQTQTNSKYRIYANDTSTAMSTPVITDKWVHLAVVRDSGTTKLFVNGIQDATTISDSRNYSGTYIAIGGYYSTSYLWVGYIQDFRVYKGLAKYTSNFIPASTNPDILPDTPSGVVGDSKLTKITDGAVYFDGTGDYLEISDNADFEMGTDDFTIEAFFYNQENAVQSMITKYGNSASDRSFWLGTLTSNNPSFYWYNGSNSYNINGYSGSLPLNKWTHVVAQRTSGDIYLFADGKVVASNTGSNAAKSFNDTSEPVVIGSDSYASNEQPFQGFISNVRIVKGTGVYNTIGFTPPTRELTDVTNTKLLCCQSNTSATEGAVKPGTITANGDAAATNFNPFNTDINTVRGQETGYATWNPLSVRSGVTFSDGNLTLTNSGSGASGWRNVACTQSVTSGKWYVEMHTIGSQNGGLMPGVCKLPEDQGTFNPGTFSNNFPGMTANSYSLNCFSGSKACKR